MWYKSCLQTASEDLLDKQERRMNMSFSSTCYFKLEILRLLKSNT